MSDDEAFEKYWSLAQPLFAIQRKTGVSFGSAKQVVVIREQIKQAYKAGWKDRGDKR